MLTLKKQTIIQATFIITISTLLSRILGFVREMIIAHFFGASQEYDTFLIGITIPTILFSTFLYTFPASFIPIYNEIKVNHDTESANKFSISFFNFYFLLFLITTTLFLLFSHNTIEFFFPSLDVENINFASKILEITSAIIIFGGGFALVRSMLNAHKQFLIPTLSQLSLNIVIIITIFFLEPYFSIVSLAIGYTFGFLTQFLISSFYGFRQNITYRFSLDYTNPYLKKSFQIVMIILSIEVIGQLNVFIDRLFVPELQVGSLAALNYATTIYLIPISAIGLAIATAIFPTLSEKIANQKWETVTNLLEQGLNWIIIISIPFMTIFMLYAKDIIEILLQRGAFNSTATTLTAQALTFYSIGLVAYSCHSIFIRLFYGVKKYKLIFFVALSGFILKITISFFLVKTIGHKGLALATSLTGIFNLFILSIASLSFISQKALFETIKTFLYTAFLSAFSYSVLNWALINFKFQNIILKLILGIFGGSAIYLVLLVLLKIKEPYKFYKKLSKSHA